MCDQVSCSWTLHLSSLSVCPKASRVRDSGESERDMFGGIGKKSTGSKKDAVEQG